jgi:branched-chain amino acid transport system ATP-binding protein
VLELIDLDIYHGDLQALWGVSLAIRDEDITTLIGSNGAGKSSTLMAIVGLLKPARGTILFDVVRLDKLAPHRIVELGISMVPEGRRLFPEMSVRQNLEIGAFIDKARRAKHETMEWIYEVFPILKERAGQRASTLSGGEQQMLGIGRALMSQPKLLLVDELSLGLAPVVVEKISDVLKGINKEKGIGIFLVEQNVQMALELADRGYIIENGRVVGQGEARVLLESEEVKGAYLGIG